MTNSYFKKILFIFFRSGFFIAPLLLIFNFSITEAALDPSTTAKKAIMLYASGTDPLPYYRWWNGATWSTEGYATAVSGEIKHLVVKFSRTRNEMILGTLDATGDIRVQVYNGTSWSATTLFANIGTTAHQYRAFDIEYETNGDRAIIVYNNANAVDPAYSIYNGTSWSATSTIDIPTTAKPYWIELATNPTSVSSEIAMIVEDGAADGNGNNVYGMIWTGSAWSNMGDATVWDSTGPTDGAGIDVAYEQQSGRAMFIWGDYTGTDQYYRIWNGSSLTSATLLDIPASAANTVWVRLAPDSSSNKLMLGLQDTSNDLNTRLWDGSSWDTATEHPEHDGSVENSSADRNFDIVFERHPNNTGKAWLVWGDGLQLSLKQWSGSAWGTAATTGDDTYFVSLASHPSGEVLSGNWEIVTTAYVREMHLTNGTSTWSSQATFSGPNTIGQANGYRIDSTICPPNYGVCANGLPSASWDNDFSTWASSSIILANYNLIDPEYDTSNISQTASSGVEYSTDGTTWSDATQGTGGDGLTGLIATSSPGTNHIFSWDRVTDLPSVEDSSVYLRLRPNDGTENASGWATSSAFALDNVAPSSVGAPTFGTITTSSIVVNKPTVVTENGSGLYQWQARRGGATALGLNSTTTGSVTDSSLSANTQYSYDAQFKDYADNSSSYGTSASVYTLAPTPANLAASSVARTSMTLSVDALDNQTSGSSGYYFVNETASTTSGWIQVNSWDDSGLTCGTSYSYTVKYRNGDGTETSEATLTQATSACPSAETTRVSYAISPPRVYDAPPAKTNDNKAAVYNDALSRDKTAQAAARAGQATARAGQAPQYAGQAAEIRAQIRQLQSRLIELYRLLIQVLTERMKERGGGL